MQGILICFDLFVSVAEPMLRPVITVLKGPSSMGFVAKNLDDFLAFSTLQNGRNALVGPSPTRKRNSTKLAGRPGLLARPEAPGSRGTPGAFQAMCGTIVSESEVAGQDHPLLFVSLRVESSPLPAGCFRRESRAPIKKEHLLRSNAPAAFAPRHGLRQAPSASPGGSIHPLPRRRAPSPARPQVPATPRPSAVTSCHREQGDPAMQATG